MKPRKPLPSGNDRTSLPPTSENGLVNVIIDTPKGSRAKFKLDEKIRYFRLSRILPVGMSFPYDFGFIPGTLGDDGDPLDVLLLGDTPSFVGCLVETKLIGVLCGRTSGAQESGPQ